MSRVSVAKTYKQYIGGAFVRSESGRTMLKHGNTVCQGSRKDVRDAVAAARAAFPGWSGRTAYNRGQILYRIAEMLEARCDEFARVIAHESQTGLKASQQEVATSIDRLVYYAGWADKYTAVLGSVNPVADRYFGFTFPEPTGVVGIVADDVPLLALVSQLAPVIASGNTAIVLASEEAPATACIFAEVLETSDLPGGVVNVLTGLRSELMNVLAKHQDVNAMDCPLGDRELVPEIRDQGAENLKRLRFTESQSRAQWQKSSNQGVGQIEAFVEYKSVWHPVGV